MAVQPTSSRLRWIAPASVVLLAVAFSVHRLEDFDTWYHLAAGRLMLATGTWPATNTFSLTAPAYPWIDLHWIFQLLLYGAWTIGGVDGAIVLAATLMGVTTFVLYGAARRFAPPAFAAFLLALALVISSPRFVPRPELLSFLYFALYLRLLEGRLRNGRAVFLLVPLQILWVNTQGIFAVGIALIGCYWLGATLAFLPLPRGWREESALDPAAWRRLTAVLGLATLACLLNPWGVEGALFPLQLLPRVTGSSLFSSRIGEFRPPLASGYAPLLVDTWVALLALAAASFVVNLRRWHLGRVFATLAFGYLSTQSLRNMAFFGWIAAPVIAANVGPWLARRTVPSAARSALAAVGIGGILLLIGAVVTNQYSRVMRIEREFGFGVSRARFPSDAVAFVERTDVTGRAFNCLAMGGYLAWSRPNDRVFVDGRLEAFPESVFRRYFAVMERPDMWPQDVAPYEPDYAFVYHGWSNRLPLVSYLARGHGWTMVYYDEIASVFVPSDDAHRETRERALSAFGEIRRARLAAPDPEPPSAWRRALSVPVAEAWRQRASGNMLRSVGLPDEAARAFRRALALDPDDTDARTNLGFVYWSLNQRDAAVEAWREVLRRDPANERVAQTLARVAGAAAR
ncbi:MAG: tetratricopeptide repeat protein [Deltaproteobacteria bacterium]|nr:tetratricopeptide repeat protein [Deltaproteobacteria bacterium]